MKHIIIQNNSTSSSGSTAYYRSTNSFISTINNSVNYQAIPFKDAGSTIMNSDITLFEPITNGVRVLKDVDVYINSTCYYNSSNNRTNVPIVIAINNIEQLITSASGYIRNASGHNESSTTISDILSLNAGDIITIKGRREAGQGIVTLLEDQSNLIIKALNTSNNTPNIPFPFPQIRLIEDDTFNHNETKTIIIRGSYFTINTTVNIPNLIVNSIAYIDDNTIEVNITSNNINGFYDVNITTLEGGDAILNNGVEVKLSTWVDLRINGDVLTIGNNNTDDVQLRSGIAATRNNNGVHFTGVNPWGSWVKFNNESFNRSDNKTVQWIFNAQNNFMVGISGSTDENSNSQWQEGCVMAYFNNSTNLWGYFGSSPSNGTTWNQSSNINFTANTPLKLKIEGNGSSGQLITLYQLPSFNINDWDDESTVLLITTSTNLNTQQQLLPFIIPNNNINNYFTALKID